MTQTLARDPRLLAAVAWALTALGSLVFAVVHLFAAIGGLVAEAGHDHEHGGHGHLEAYAELAEPNSGFAWMVAVIYSLSIVPALLPLVLRGRPAAIATLAIGGLLALGSVVDGFNHGLVEGAVPALLTALVAVGLPGAVAVVATIRWIRAAAPSRPSPATAETTEA